MTALHALTVPKWGMSMEEGEVLEWRVAVGDTLAQGDEYVDIETSKIVNTAECPVAGTLARIIGQPGETLQVGMLLGVVAEGDVGEAELDNFIANFVPDANAAARAQSSAVVSAPEKQVQTAGAAPVASAAPVAEPAPISSPRPDLSAGPDDSEVKSSPVARRIAREFNINLHNVRPTGRGGRVSKWDVEEAAGVRVLAASADRPSEPAGASSAPGRSTADDSHIAATPVARRLAASMGINLHDVPATGTRGRVSKADVERAAIALTGVAQYTEQKFSGMRKTIAARLSESKQTIPHFRVSVDIEIDSLLQQRKYMNSELDLQLSVNDFVIKACAATLTRVPQVNVQYTGDSVRLFEQVNISMAVAIDDGLVTPVIRDAAGKSLTGIAAEAKELTQRAQQGRLGLDELSGGTFSISNLGMYGVDEFDAIINPPQAAILAVAAGQKKPVVRGDTLVAATVMRVTLSSDHRVIDGAVAARFLQVLKGLLENPAAILL